MRASSKKIVAMLMLTIFCVSLGAYGFSPMGLAHELGHNSHTLVALGDGDQAPRLDIQDGGDTEPSSEAQHQLQHAAEHLQPLLLASIGDGIGPSPAKAKPMLLHLLALPPAELEPPYRPPQAAFRI